MNKGWWLVGVLVNLKYLVSLQLFPSIPNLAHYYTVLSNTSSYEFIYCGCRRRQLHSTLATVNTDNRDKTSSILLTESGDLVLKTILRHHDPLNFRHLVQQR